MHAHVAFGYTVCVVHSYMADRVEDIHCASGLMVRAASNLNLRPASSFQCASSFTYCACSCLRTFITPGSGAYTECGKLVLNLKVCVHVRIYAIYIHSFARHAKHHACCGGTSHAIATLCQSGRAISLKHARSLHVCRSASARQHSSSTTSDTKL